MAPGSTEEAPDSTLTGRPLPRNPWSRFFLGLKVGLATAIALGIDHLTGNPDHVSSTFIAAVCVSPVVLIGLRRARDQVVGSAIGGTWGTLLALGGAPPELGIPLATGLGVLCCFLFGFGEGYLLATFAALFVQAVPFGDPWSTLGIRGLAVGTGALSGLAVNVGVSAFAYRSIFRRRLIFADSKVARTLWRATHESLGLAREPIPYLNNLNQELESVRREMEWRGESLEWIDRHRDDLQNLRRLIHLVCDLDELIREYRETLTLDPSSDPERGLQQWLRQWLQGQESPDRSGLPTALNGTLDRLLKTRLPKAVLSTIP